MCRSSASLGCGEQLQRGEYLLLVLNQRRYTWQWWRQMKETRPCTSAGAWPQSQLRFECDSRFRQGMSLIKSDMKEQNEGQSPEKPNIVSLSVQVQEHMTCCHNL